MNWSEIGGKLETHLAALPNAPPVFFENQIPAKKPGVFLAATHLPSQSRTDTYCLTEVKDGLFSINIHTPAQDGRRMAETLADALHSHFRHRDLGGLYCGDVSRSQGIHTATHFVINVSVRYRTLEI